MEKVRTRAELVERLKDLLVVEMTARDKYEQDIITFKNFELVDTIRKIKEDEEKHVGIVTRLIKMLEK